MSFIENIKKCIGYSDNPELAEFRVVSFAFRSAYFENVKAIISYDEQEITLSLKRGGIRVSGKELYVKKYCAGDVVICGEISKIEKF